MRHNPNCDGSGPHDDGIVRVLPLAGAGSNHGNLILCYPCYRREILWRVGRNIELGAGVQYDCPTWSSLKQYEGAGV